MASPDVPASKPVAAVLRMNSRLVIIVVPPCVAVSFVDVFPPTRLQQARIATRSNGRGFQ